MKDNLLKIFGIFILVYLLQKVDISLIWSHIKGCNQFLLLAALLLEISCVIFKSMKWRLILNSLKIDAGFTESLCAYWSGLYFAAITPGKVGDISRVYFLKHNKTIGRPVFSVILDRLTDVFSLLLLGLAVSFFYLKELSRLSSLLFILLLVLILSVWVIFLKRDFFYQVFKKIMHKFALKNRIPLKENLELGVLKTIKAKDYFLIFMYILAGWLVYFIGWWFLIKALHINISFFNTVGAVSIATIVSLIPISISGLGTRDAAVVFIFSKIYLTKDAALSFSLMIFAIEIFIVCLGIVFFLKVNRKISLNTNV